MAKGVVKFGGSNLKSSCDIAKIVQVVRLYGRELVIVVSALYGVTDVLLDSLLRARTDTDALDRVRRRVLPSYARIVAEYVPGHRKKEVKQQPETRVTELEKYLLGIHCLGDIPCFVRDRVLSFGERLSSLTITAVLNASGIPCRECLPEELGLLTNGSYSNASVAFNQCRQRVRARLGQCKTRAITAVARLSASGPICWPGTRFI